METWHGSIGPVYISSLEEYERLYGGTAVLDRPDTDVTPDDGDTSGAGDWFTIKGKPWRCPCGASSPYMAESKHPHRIIVWPSEDDPNMVKTLRQIQEEDGETASIVAYEKSMGPCVSHYEATPS